MKPLSSWVSACVVGAVAIACATPAEARQANQGAPGTPAAYNQVISANPFGLLLGWFNAEYERKVSESATAGVGGSALTEDGNDYVNADVFYRYYPSGHPLDGWAFGIKMGATKVESGETFFGLGFDVNRSWLLGKKDNFSVGVGFGLKRLYGTGDRYFDLKIIPTVRLINIGFAF